MNFWERVVFLLDEKNIPRKDLAATIGFHQSNIGKGILNNNVPSADTAVRIAQYLDSSVEFLVTGKDTDSSQSQLLEEYMRYAPIVKSLKIIPKKRRTLIEQLIHQVSLTYTNEISEMD